MIKRHMTVVDILPEEYKCFNLFPGRSAGYRYRRAFGTYK